MPDLEAFPLLRNWRPRKARAHSSSEGYEEKHFRGGYLVRAE